MDVRPLPDRFTIQAVGGPVLTRLSFSLDHTVSLVSRVVEGEPVPEGLEATLAGAYADVLLVDHGLFAEAWTSEADSEALLAEHDRFAKAVLGTYAPTRVVLLRSSVRRFYWSRGQVLPRRHAGDPRDVEALRRFLAELDRRFHEATGCTVVDTVTRHLPTRDALAHRPGLEPEAILAIEDAVLAAFRAPAPAPDALSVPTDTGFAAAVQRGLLAGPLDPEWVLELLPAGGLDTREDAAALAAAWSAARDADWSVVAARAVPSRGTLREAMEQRFAANLAALRTHRHVYVPGGLDFGPRSLLVTKLAPSWFLVVRPDGERPVRMRRYGRRQLDPVAFCDAGYVCAPDQIETALESWEAYFERGRRGDTAPFRIGFRNRWAFRESLDYLDYADILANENYCLTIEGKVPAGTVWKPKVDTSFLFDPRTRVCMMAGGIGDQLCRYVDARAIVLRHGLRFFVDDLWFDHPDPRMRWAHARPDLVGLVATEGLFSELLSRRLRQRRRVRRHEAVDRSEYADLGLEEQVLIIERGRLLNLVKTDADPRAQLVVALTMDQLDRSIVLPPPGVTFIDVIAKRPWVKDADLRHKDRWEQAVRWPGFASGSSAVVADHMRRTDAVVVHVRRGDRVAIGAADADHYYRGYLQRIAAMPDYPNMHLFVFSDDPDYCRSHAHELGLDLIGEAPTFVDGNRHFASVDDFMLMALGQVIVCGRSGFSGTAARVSTRVEYVFGEGYGTDGRDTWQRSRELAT